MCREETTFVPVVCLALLVSRHAILDTWDMPACYGVFISQPIFVLRTPTFVSESDTNAANS
jgi:hypothetical protein